LRPGERISSATYDAAFHPEYENITGMKARKNPLLSSGADMPRFVTWPLPMAKPTTIKTTRATTLPLASTF
jgi:hypothetical protein